MMCYLRFVRLLVLSCVFKSPSILKIHSCSCCIQSPPDQNLSTDDITYSQGYVSGIQSPTSAQNDIVVSILSLWEFGISPLPVVNGNKSQKYALRVVNSSRQTNSFSALNASKGLLCGVRENSENSLYLLDTPNGNDLN